MQTVKLSQLDVAEIVRLLKCVRVLDSGAHFCRYCPAKSPEWDHAPSCPYVQSQHDHTDAQQLIAVIQASPEWILFEGNDQ